MGPKYSMTTIFEPNRWYDHRDSTAQQLRTRFSVPTAWFRRSCNVVNAASIIPSPYDDERFITVCLVYPRAAHVKVAQVLALAPWAFVVYWPVLNQKQLITVVGASVADPAAFAAEHNSLALAWYISSTGQLYTYTPRAIADNYYQQNPFKNYDRRGPKGVDHREVHDALESGQFSVKQICDQYHISRQTISNIRKKFNTFRPYKRQLPANLAVE